MTQTTVVADLQARIAELEERIIQIEAAAEDIWVNSLGHSGDTGDCAEYYLANIKLDLAEMFGRPSPPEEQ